MKVLHVYRTYFPDSQGGVQEAIRQIARSTHACGVENRIFTLSEYPVPVEIDSPEGRIVRVKQQFEIASCGFALRGLNEFRRQTDWADIVHYHYPWPYGDLLHLMAGSPAPSVLTYHSDIVRQQLLSLFYKPVMDRFLGGMDRIVCTSPNYSATSKTLGRFSSRVDIVPIGLDEASYPVPDDDFVDQVEAEYGRDFFLFIGVWRYYKGLHILLDAVRDSGTRLVVVGSGPIESKILAKAEKMGLDNVRFPGYVDDSTKVALLRLCRAVVLPSHLRSEAFGMTLLESAMYSKPMICAEVGSGTSYINVDGQTGLVVAPNSPAALREAMDYLDANPGAASAMGANARQRFLDNFTGDIMGQRYQDVYDSVLAARPDRTAQ